MGKNEAYKQAQSAKASAADEPPPGALRPGDDGKYLLPMGRGGPVSLILMRSLLLPAPNEREITALPARLNTAP